MVFGNNIDIAREIQSANESSLSFQIILRLGLMVLGLACAVWGWWFRPPVRFALMTIPGLFLLTLGAWHLMTAPLALMPTKAFIGFFSLMAAMMVSINTLYEFGLKRLTILAIVGIVVYLLASIGLYVVAPELATFKEVMNDVVTIERFAGLSHPNFTGRYAVLSVFLAIIAIRCDFMNWKWIIPIFFLALGVLVASLSRTPVVAGIAASAVIMLPLLRWGETYLAIALASVVLLLGYVAMESTIGFDFVVDQLVEKTTKTGSSEEIKTGTGRTDIWAYSISKTIERPVFGWGIGSTALVMEDQSGHSHNILLHPTLALGLPGGALVLLILLMNLYAALKTGHPFITGIITFIVVLGLVESPLLGSFPDGVCMLWFVITILPVYMKLNDPRPEM